MLGEGSPLAGDEGAELVEQFRADSSGFANGSCHANYYQPLKDSPSSPSRYGWPMDADRVRGDLVTMLTATRAAERELFARFDPATRDSPPAPGEWSPKDIQAHLSGWKARQVKRYEAARNGQGPDTPDGREIDEVNAEMHEARAAWPWDDVLAEADQVSDQLVAQVQAADPPVLLGPDSLLGSTFGNGASHALEHLPQLARRVGDESAVDALAAELARLASSGSIPERDAATLVYNLACFQALAGRLDAARDLLPGAFRLRPDLLEWGLEDSDLAALHDELAALAAQ